MMTTVPGFNLLIQQSGIVREVHQSSSTPNPEPGQAAAELVATEQAKKTNVQELEESERLKTKKSIAKKRTLAKARKHFEGNKEKYYKEVKAGSKLLPEQQKAIEFFNRYTKDQEETSKLNTQKAEVFTQKTNALFNEEFKGFEFKVGDKRFRYNVKDANSVKESQATLENFTKKYLGDDNTLSDAKGYHKALFTAMNADSIADHFYKQGKADALKVSASRKKNINMEGRQDHNNNQNTQSGLRAKVVENDSPRPGKLTFKKY